MGEKKSKDQKIEELTIELTKTKKKQDESLTNSIPSPLPLPSRQVEKLTKELDLLRKQFQKQQKQQPPKIKIPVLVPNPMSLKPLVSSSPLSPPLSPVVASRCIVINPQNPASLKEARRQLVQMALVLNLCGSCFELNQIPTVHFPCRHTSMCMNCSSHCVCLVCDKNVKDFDLSPQVLSSLPPVVVSLADSDRIRSNIENRIFKPVVLQCLETKKKQFPSANSKQQEEKK